MNKLIYGQSTFRDCPLMYQASGWHLVRYCIDAPPRTNWYKITEEFLYYGQARWFERLFPANIRKCFQLNPRFLQ